MEDLEEILGDWLGEELEARLTCRGMYLIIASFLSNLSRLCICNTMQGLAGVHGLPGLVSGGLAYRRSWRRA